MQKGPASLPGLSFSYFSLSRLGHLDAPLQPRPRRGPRAGRITSGGFSSGGLNYELPVAFVNLSYKSAKQPRCAKFPLRQELSAKVLAAIRKDPKFGTVKEIAITHTEILGAGTSWHVNIVDSGNADVELVVTVARRIQENLGSSFEVID